MYSAQYYHGPTMYLMNIYIMYKGTDIYVGYMGEQYT